MEHEVSNDLPSAEEFCALRIASGLTGRDLSAVEEALPRTLHSVTIRDADNQLIAMGRVVGDGLHVQVVDIAVAPEMQGQGLSRLVMEDIMAYLETLPPLTSVKLFADVDWLYHKFGFEVPEHTTGMSFPR